MEMVIYHVHGVMGVQFQGHIAMVQEIMLLSIMLVANIFLLRQLFTGYGVLLLYQMLIITTFM